MLTVALFTRTFIFKNMNENKSLTNGKVEFEEKTERRTSLPSAFTQLDREKVISTVVQDLREGGQIYQALQVGLKRAKQQREPPF